MNGYPSYPRRPFQPPNNGNNIMDLTGDGMDAFVGGDSQSLDDIVSQNDKANRRRSMPVYTGNGIGMGSPDSRRLSMMNFTDMPGGDFDGFQFNMGDAATMGNLMRSNTSYTGPGTTSQNEEVVPASDLAINT